jgi:tartrate dehydratase beta subunit/fumarate hydratase class I family protein
VLRSTADIKGGEVVSLAGQFAVCRDERPTGYKKHSKEIQSLVQNYIGRWWISEGQG